MSTLDGLGLGLGRAPIIKLDRRPSPYASSFALEEIDVVFADGSEAALVMKDLSPDAMDEGARRARPAFLAEPRREIEMYRHILPQAPPGTAACYGVASEHRLLLERVDGHELRHVGAFSMWKRTAQWIARFHASAPTADEERLELARRAKLLIYDEAFYWRWLERARDFAARSRRTEAAGGAEARRVLDRIARGYAPVVARLAAMPRTVIHGEFYPCNILIRGRGPRARVCPVDWELAAFGPGPIDLAALMTGWDEKAQQALSRAYRTALSEGGASEPVARDEAARFQTDLDCCRLHLAVRMLGWSGDWTPPPQHARDWLAEAEALAGRLGRDSRLR